MLIDYKNVDVFQSDCLVLHVDSFSVDEGEFVYIIGKVGSGKSSIARWIFPRKQKRLLYWKGI